MAGKLEQQYQSVKQQREASNHEKQKVGDAMSVEQADIDSLMVER